LSDLERALNEVANIRDQLATGTVFRGFGPFVIAGSGVLALATGGVQVIWPSVAASNPTNYVFCWIAVAVLVAVLIGVSVITRSNRLHGNMAKTMIMTAIEQFLPVCASGAAISAVLLKYAPGSLWILPGLWQVLVAIGIFGSLKTLPKSMSLAGAWYFLSGIFVLVFASVDQELSPWMMALPFAVGQFLVASILWLANGGDDAQQV
jgi:hypothetical protein